MDRFDIPALRSLPIKTVATILGMVSHKGHYLCPCHPDRDPSLTLSTSRNTWRCWACGEHGDSIELVRRNLNVGFTEACQWLCQEYNIIRNKETNNQSTMDTTTYNFIPDIYEEMARTFSSYGTEALEFMHIRNLDPVLLRSQNVVAINASGQWTLEVLRRSRTEEDLRQCGLLCGEGTRTYFYFPTPCLLFYYYSLEGNLIGVQSRYLGGQMRFLTPEAQARHDAYVKRCPRFKFARGCSPTIYNQPVMKTLQPGEELWIAEGITDCLALLSSGRKAIAIPSATLLTRQNIELLATVSTKNFHMAPDADAAGESLFGSLQTVCNQLGVTLTRHQLPAGCKDFGDFWASQK